MTDARAKEILREIVSLRKLAEAMGRGAMRSGTEKDERLAQNCEWAVTEAIDLAAKELGE